MSKWTLPCDPVLVSWYEFTKNKSINDMSSTIGKQQAKIKYIIECPLSQFSKIGQSLNRITYVTYYKCSKHRQTGFVLELINSFFYFFSWVFSASVLLVLVLSSPSPGRPGQYQLGSRQYQPLYNPLQLRQPSAPPSSWVGN